MTDYIPRTSRSARTTPGGRGRMLALLFMASGLIVGCSEQSGVPEARAVDGTTAVAGLQAFVSATLIDGTGADPIENGVIVSRDGVIDAVGTEGDVQIPNGAEVIDLEGRWILPGFVNAHGHVSGDRDAAEGQLEQYAHYGITTVVSLGGEQPDAFELRDEQADPDLDRARIFVAGPVLSPSSADDARTDVAELAAMNPDWVKIRVDNRSGPGGMAPEVYRAVIEASDEAGLPVAVHIVTLEDALGVLNAGARVIAHSVRDAPVGPELTRGMLEAGVCLIPTFTRELSSFVYAERPAFFDDPFFLDGAAPDDLDEFLTPNRQAQASGEDAAFWREALPVAYENMNTLYRAGVGVAMGTDTGPTGRFQGYFEHLELEMMVEAGMTPAEAIHAATGAGAACMGLGEQVGTLSPGRYTDLLVLTANPFEDIMNTREVDGVWIAGNRVR